MMCIFDGVDFEIKSIGQGWIYLLKMNNVNYISSIFESQQEAFFALIGHIDFNKKQRTNDVKET